MITRTNPSRAGRRRAARRPRSRRGPPTGGRSTPPLEPLRNFSTPARPPGPRPSDFIAESPEPSSDPEPEPAEWGSDTEPSIDRMPYEGALLEAAADAPPRTPLRLGGETWPPEIRTTTQSRARRGASRPRSPRRRRRPPRRDRSAAAAVARALPSAGRPAHRGALRRCRGRRPASACPRGRSSRTSCAARCGRQRPRRMGCGLRQRGRRRRRRRPSRPRSRPDAGPPPRP